MELEYRKSPIDGASMAIATFDNVADFQEFLKKPKSPVASSDSRNTDPYRIRAFYETPSYEVADNLFVQGDAKSLEQIEKTSDLIESRIVVPASMVRRVEMVQSLHGSMVSMGDYLTGNPYCMLQPTPTERRGKSVVRLGANFIASARVSSDVLRLRGTGIMTLANVISKYGYQLEFDALYNVSPNYPGKVRLFARLPIKKAGEYTDKTRMAYMGNPSFLRRHWFAACERMPDDIAKSCGSGYYGSPCNIDTDLVKDYDVYISSVYGFDSTESTIKWVQSQLDRIGKGE